MLFRRAARYLGGILLFGLLAVLSGCGGGDTRTRANVKGKVTLGGKNLTAGTVMFYGPNNITSTGIIDKEGNYEVPDAPLGDVKITVSVPKLPPGGIAKLKVGANLEGSKDPSGSGKSISIMGSMPTHVVPIPDKYSRVETSGLTYKVEKGDHTHNIELTP
jgi:hypothetical protein